MERNYPFTAIVGQDQMKLALILNLINPALGGVLIRGEKGTAKSTAVRGLTELLEQVQAAEGCPFHCRPGYGELCTECREKQEKGTLKTAPYTRRVIELPVSSTEDRVVGSLSMEQAIRKGEKSGRFQMERVGIGYLNLYGVLPTDHFLDLMANYYEDTFGPDYDALVRILRESPLLRVCRNVDKRGDYLFSPCVGNPEEVFLLREELALNPAEFKAFPVEMALEAGAGAPYFTVGTKTPEGETLTRLLRQIGYEGFDLVKAQHDIWAEAQFPFGNKALFAPVIDRRDTIASDAVHYASLKAIVDYANSVPKWTLNGYNALEMDVLVLESPPPEDPAENLTDDADYPRWTMPRPTISEGYSDLIEKDEVLDRLSPLMPEGFPFGLAIPHVAPMDPCPCGSGLRYCHCHGKNLN